MVKIRIEKGIWEGDDIKRDLIWEKCPNPECCDAELHYPFFMERPHCPDCKTRLIGHKLQESSEKRVAYALEI